MLIVLSIFVISLFCIAGLVIFGVLAIVTATKKGKTAKTIKIVSIVLAVVCLIGSVPAIVGIASVADYCSTVPENFVNCQTTVTFDKDGFVDSNGQQYLRLPYQHTGTENNQPTFAYKPEGAFSKHKWANVFTFTTSSNFQLYYYVSQISFNDDVFCKQGDYDDIIAYYQQNCYWKGNFAEQNCSQQLIDIIEKYKAMTNAQLLDWDIHAHSIDVYCNSNDHLLQIDECSFAVVNDVVYICTQTDAFNGFYGFELTAEEKVVVLQQLFESTTTID